MRNRFIKSCLILSVCLALPACSDDKDAVTNYFELDSEKREVRGAELTYRTEYSFMHDGHAVYHHKITFQTVPMNSAPEEVRSNLQLTITNGNTGLTPGVYTWVTNQWAPFNVVEGTAHTNTSQNTAGHFYQVSAGTLTIAGGEGRYVVDFEGTGSNITLQVFDRPVRLHFEGSLLKQEW